MIEVIYNMKNMEFFIDEFVLMVSGKPFNYQNAMSDFEFDIWLRVMNAEMQSMYNNQVWGLINLYPYSKTKRSKWFFKKENKHGWKSIYIWSTTCYKKINSYSCYLTMIESFSQVSTNWSTRILFTITTYYDYELW